MFVCFFLTLGGVRGNMIWTQTVELFDGEAFQLEPSTFPVKVGRHCGAAISSDSVLFTGGELHTSTTSTTNRAFIYHISTHTFEEVPPMVTY